MGMSKMITKLKIYKGLTLGDGNRAITVEKVNSENIYLRLQDGNQRRILPTQLILDLLLHLRNKKITIDDIYRKKRKDKNLPPLFTELKLDYENFILGYESSISKICEYELNNSLKKSKNDSILLPKPFILLAGISGTGKTRFVIEQAKNSAEKFDLKENYNCCLVPVRPDWHEPSDLLGYISRISGTNYISTDFLNFIVKAWCNAIESVDSQSFQLNPIEQIAPFWLCLDEMNLAPVEQYFADYLSILETRKWDADNYFCHPIMTKNIMGKLRDSKTSAGINSMDSLWSEIFKDIDVNDSYKDALCEYFELNGIALPPNLIVAGTVNMDETTHGFSRKVIDRALTIDFGEFFPNDYDCFFKDDKKTQFKTLTNSWLTHTTKEDLSSTIDVDGGKSITFLTAVNTILKQTPFELAYRALNELLLQVACFNPQTEADLQAVWDDFLMSKVLPRIDGDEDKLRDVKEDSSNNLLESLSVLLKGQLDEIWDGTRLDFYRETMDGSAITDIACRSKVKLSWMQNRLEINTFTSYWP